MTTKQAFQYAAALIFITQTPFFLFAFFVFAYSDNPSTKAKAAALLTSANSLILFAIATLQFANLLP